MILTKDMKNKIKQIVTEINKEKEKSEMQLNDASNLTMILAYTMQSNAFSLCIDKLEKLLKEEFQETLG